MSCGAKSSLLHANKTPHDVFHGINQIAQCQSSKTAALKVAENAAEQQQSLWKQSTMSHQGILAANIASQPKTMESKLRVNQGSPMSCGARSSLQYAKKNPLKMSTMVLTQMLSASQTRMMLFFILYYTSR
jgi:hypothetical protein